MLYGMGSNLIFPGETPILMVSWPLPLYLVTPAKHSHNHDDVLWSIREANQTVRENIIMVDVLGKVIHK